ncbi:MAG: tRNA (adenosine(37)-N6)-dimethylallyltransferase MiaA, partial [Dehalococcoidia bacterium]
YKQIGMFLKGAITLATAIQQIKYETHLIARHQYSWFQLKDSRIKWFDIKDSVGQSIIRLVSNFRRGT